jgi:hypothetical protein
MTNEDSSLRGNQYVRYQDRFFFKMNIPYVYGTRVPNWEEFKKTTLEVRTEPERRKRRFDDRWARWRSKWTEVCNDHGLQHSCMDPIGAAHRKELFDDNHERWITEESFHIDWFAFDGLWDPRYPFQQDKRTQYCSDFDRRPCRMLESCVCSDADPECLQREDQRKQNERDEMESYRKRFYEQECIKMDLEDPLRKANIERFQAEKARKASAREEELALKKAESEQWAARVEAHFEAKKAARIAQRDEDIRNGHTRNPRHPLGMW